MRMEKGMFGQLRYMTHIMDINMKNRYSIKYVKNIEFHNYIVYTVNIKIGMGQARMEKYGHTENALVKYTVAINDL